MKTFICNRCKELTTFEKGDNYICSKCGEALGKRNFTINPDAQSWGRTTKIEFNTTTIEDSMRRMKQ